MVDHRAVVGGEKDLTGKACWHVRMLAHFLTTWLSSWLHWASMMWRQQLLLLQHG
jgi:hypothetical protein